MPISLALILSLVFFSVKSIDFSLIFIFPLEGSSIRDNKFNNVDFPDPEGPIS